MPSSSSKSTNFDLVKNVCSESVVSNFHRLYIGLAKKSLFSFFCKIKDTFFIFTHNFIDLDILSMSALAIGF